MRLVAKVLDELLHLFLAVLAMARQVSVAVKVRLHEPDRHARDVEFDGPVVRVLEMSLEEDVLLVDLRGLGGLVEDGVADVALGRADRLLVPLEERGRRLHGAVRGEVLVVFRNAHDVGIDGIEELDVLGRHLLPLGFGNRGDGIRSVAEMADAPVHEADAGPLNLLRSTPSRHASDGNSEDNVSHGGNYTKFFTGSQEDRRRGGGASRGRKAPS